MKNFKVSIKKVLSVMLAVICTLSIFPAFTKAEAAMPSISNSRYMKTYTISTANTPVYTSSALNRRGTSSPYKNYNAVIYGSDEIYVYSIVNNSAYVSYGTSSGRRYGWISLNAITSNNYSQSTTTSRAQISTYKRPGGASYGFVAKNDTVYTMGSSNGYIQIVYAVDNNTRWKCAWVKTSDYNNYIKPGNNPKGCVDSVVSNNANQITINGWAFDYDSISSKIRIDCYIGGTAGSGAPCYSIYANTYRPDVNNVFKTGTYHGFSKTITLPSNITGTKTIYIYAINVAGGSNTLIGTRTVNIKGKAENRPISDGTYYIASAANQSMVLDLFGAATNNGASSVLHQKNNGTNQQVEVKYVGDNYYTIKFVHSEKYLDASGARAVNGATLIQQDFNGGSNQYWFIKKNSNGTYSIKSKMGNYYVDVNGGVFTNGQKMQIWEGNGTISQQFYFQPVNTGVIGDKFENPMSNMYCTWSTKTNMSWGQKISSNATGRVYHVGIDVYGTNGNVNSTANGKVAATGYNSANGNYVIIQHTLSGKTVYSFYAHLSRINVTKGQSVSVGQNIGVAGNTGSSSKGTHLHFAIVDTLWSNGGYYGYATSFSGNKVTYGGVTYYNPMYIINYDKLP